MRDASALERENEVLRQRVAAAEQKFSSLTREQTNDERNALAAIQARADSIASMFGESGPAPAPGESVAAFRLRALQRFQKHSPAFKDVRLDRADPAYLDLAEARIFADAEAKGRSGSATPGKLITVVETDAAGRKITKYYGDIGVFMGPFTSTGATCRVTRPGFDR